MITLLSGIFGGLLRLAPEILGYFKAKQEMRHELDMQEKAYQFQVLKGDQKIDEIQQQGKADWDKGGLDALREAIKGQDTPLPMSGVRWVDILSALSNLVSKMIRPMITIQWVILLYPGIIVTTFIILLQSNVGVIPAMTQVFGPEEKALVAFIVDFWFVGRVIEAGRKRNL